MIKKNYIISIILITILISLEIVVLILKGNYTKNSIEAYFLANNFIKDESGLLVKKDPIYPLEQCNENTTNQECMGQNIYFSLEDNTLLFNKNLKKDGVMFSLNATYRYASKKIEYTYRITYKEGVLMLKGSYISPEKEYTCNKEYAFGIENTNYKDICKEFKYDLEEFYYEAVTLITDANILQEISSN